MSTARRLPVALGAAGLAVALASAIPTIGERSGRITSYGAISPAAAVLEFLTGGALLAAAVVLATDPRRRASAAAMFFIGIAWFSSVWIGSAVASTVLENVALLLAPMVAPAALLVVATLPTSRRARALGASVAIVTTAWSVVLWLVRDPFLDRYCWRDCLVNAYAPFADVERARTAANVALALDVACGLVILAICLVGLRSQRPAGRTWMWAFAPGLAVGTLLAGSSLVLLIEPSENPERELFTVLFVARAVALAALAAGVIVGAVTRRRVVRREIARFARDAGHAGRASLAASLAHAFDDPELQVGYPLPDGAVVDADGRPMTVADTATRLVHSGQLVALVSSPAGVPEASLERELGHAGRLSLANERLRAEQLARLRELTELRRRIVATGDATRRRLERDLHDGAQQRLLALTFDLRVAIARAEAAEQDDTVAILRSALEQVMSATASLREMAHGIFPAVLTTSGLVAAVETLADTRSLTLTGDLSPERRFPPDFETAAYAVVAESLEDASSRVGVRITATDAELIVAIDAPWNGGVVSVEDRVGAVGGTIEQVGSRVVVRLPAE